MKNSPKIHLKVCGMRDAENIAALVALQPDFIGFIFHDPSPRYCNRIPDVHIPETIAKVGVFVNKPEEYILAKKEAFNLNFIQLHGSESPDFCQRIARNTSSVIKAFNLSDNFDFSVTEAYAPFCDYLLFDASGPLTGGNGLVFNWEILENYRGNIPFLLSGGIDENMATAIKQINHPAFYGVDINSRFEIRPGLKNIDKIKQFKDEIQS